MKTTLAYSVQTINVPGGVAEVGSINDSGTIVGTYYSPMPTGPLPTGSFADSNGSVTTIDVPGATQTIVSSINDRGDIAGEYVAGGVDYGFIDTDGSFTTIFVPGETGTIVEAINDRDEAIGTYTGGLGFIYENGSYTTINPPGSVGGGVPVAINNSGEVVGYYANNSGEHSFVDKNGRFTTFDDPGASTVGQMYGPASTTATAINDRGVIAGVYIDSNEVEHGFVDDNGRFTTIDVPGATGTVVQAINDRGDLAGYYDTAGGDVHGFVYHDGSFTTIDGPGAYETFISGINNRDEVIGNYSDVSGGGGFVATLTRSGSPTKLQDLANDPANITTTDLLPGALTSTGQSTPGSGASALPDQPIAAPLAAFAVTSTSEPAYLSGPGGANG